MTPAASGTRRRCLCSTPPGRAGRSIIYTATMTIPGLLCRSYNRYLSAVCRRYPVVGCNLPVQGRPHHRFVRRYGRRWYDHVKTIRMTKPDGTGHFRIFLVPLKVLKIYNFKEKTPSGCGTYAAGQTCPAH